MDYSSLSFPQLQQQAINAALSANWEEALNLNQKILEVEPNNVDALNRLARAYFELGDLANSFKHYEQSLKIDPYNQIAAKFIKRLEACHKKPSSKETELRIAKKNNHAQPPVEILTDLFIEEPGKTKIVNLLKLAEPQKLSYLCPGEIVQLVPKNRYVSVTDNGGEYLGILPDDLSRRLIRFINGGNKYHALIKTIKTNGLTILIRETYRSARFKNQPSFLDAASESFIYSSDHINLLDDHESVDIPEEAFDEEVAD